MEVKVLGPLKADDDGHDATPSAAKPRQIFALLALRAGELVTVEKLLEEVWCESPPKSAMTTLQTYILQIRRLLAHNRSAAEAKRVLATRYNSYVLCEDDVEVDARRFTQLSADGVRAWELGHSERSSQLLQKALDMWTGQVLADVCLGHSLEVEKTRLEQTWLATVETKTDADLSLGRHQHILGDLAAAASELPMHENLSARYMVALYRSGQQWRALETFQALRNTLNRELGIEPSARLQRLQQAILSADPGLELTTRHSLHVLPPTA